MNLKIAVKAFLALGCLGLISCKDNPGIEIKSTDNKNFPVEKLFTVDGCTVYRFDDYYSRYFTNCHGSTQWVRTRSNGKTNEYIHEGVEGE